MDRIGATIWAKYKNLQKVDSVSMFSQADVTWLRSKGNLDPFGEDADDEVFETISLKAQFLYNYFRNWPIDKNDNTGKIDNENEAMLLGVKYLLDNGWLLDGKFNFDPSADKFIHLGIEYRCEGFTPFSQAKDEALHIMIILKRQITITGSRSSTLTL